jgi:hypothetical protein
MRTLQYLEDPLSAVRELARVTRPGGLVVLVEGGMDSVDLPDTPLTHHVFGPRLGFGRRLPGLLREAGLTRITVRPAFAVELGQPDPAVLDYARSQTAFAVENGLATQAEAETWFAELDAVIARNAWFAATCLFVVAGTVPRRDEGTL